MDKNESKLFKMAESVHNGSKWFHIGPKEFKWFLFTGNCAE